MIANLIDGGYLTYTGIVGWSTGGGRIWVQFDCHPNPIQLYREFQSGIESGRYGIIVDALNNQVSDWESERYDEKNNLVSDFESREELDRN